MGWEPVCWCPDCGDALEVYMPPGDRRCECCEEMSKIECLEEQGKHDERHHDHIT